MTYDFSPIRALFRDREDIYGFISDSELATLLGVNRATILRWKHKGISEKQADRVAVSLGFVPASLWPEFNDVDISGPLTPEEEKAQNRLEKSAARKRRRYRTNPSFRRHVKEYAHQYYLDCAEAVKAQKRRYRAQNRERLNAARRERYAQDSDHRQRRISQARGARV